MSKYPVCLLVTISVKFGGLCIFASYRYCTLYQRYAYYYFLKWQNQKKKKKKKPYVKQRGVGALCKVLLKNLHPQVKIQEKFPVASRSHKQEISGCKIVKRETRNVGKKRVPSVCIIFTHEAFGTSLIYCTERWAKVQVEGHSHEFFDKKEDLPALANAPTFTLEDLDRPIGTSLLDKIGRTSRAEDIAMARAQGLDVDDDNDPAPENIPVRGAPAESDANPHGQEWGWGGTCHRKSQHHSDVNAQVVNHCKAELIGMTKLQMFLLFFPIAYLDSVVTMQTSLTLQRQAHKPLSFGEFIRFLGCILFMSCFSGLDRKDYFSSAPITMEEGAPYRLTMYMPGYRFEQIMSCLTITPSVPSSLDRFWEVRRIIYEWNKNMQEVYIPSWVSCLDESMSIWNQRWTCPGYVFCPRKPHPVGNEYHTIADGMTTILYAAEIVMGKDTPVCDDDNEEEGKTSALLARLTRSIWHTGKVVVLDSGFCVLEALINLKKKRGLFAAAVIKKRKYWPKFVQGTMIDIKFCDGYEVGDTDSLHGTMNGVPYDIFCMKEEDYVMKIMSTYGSNTPPMRERLKAKRTKANGEKVVFEYIEPVANHFDYRHCVDDNNHLRHMRPSIEETWKTHRWALRVFAFFIAVSEVNAFLCFRHWVWGKSDRMYFHKFRRGLAMECLQNLFDEDDGVVDNNLEQRRSPRQATVDNHRLEKAPTYCTKWTVREGWIKNCASAYQQACCNTRCGTQCRTFCACDPGVFLCSGCHVLHVHHVLSGGLANEITPTRTKKRQLKMD